MQHTTHYARKEPSIYMDGRHICLVGLLFCCCCRFFFFLYFHSVCHFPQIPYSLSFTNMAAMDTCAHVDISTIVCMCMYLDRIVYLHHCVCMCWCAWLLCWVAYNSNVCCVHICVAAHQNSVSKYIYWLIRKLLLYQSDMICIDDGPKLVSFFFFSSLVWGIHLHFHFRMLVM